MVSSADRVTIDFLDKQSCAGIVRALREPRHSYRHGELRLPTTLKTYAGRPTRSFYRPLATGKGLKFLIRSRPGEYKEKATSKAFPFLTPQDFVRFIEQYGELSEHDLVTGFVNWARKRRKESQK